MGVKKCPKCGSVWYTALVKCAFCGVEGEEVKGPISPAKLNLVHGGVSTAPPKPPEPAPIPEAAPPVEVHAAEPPVPIPDPVPEIKLPTPVERPPDPPPAPPPFEDELKDLPTPIEPKPPVRPEKRFPPRVQPEVESTTPAPMIPSATVPLVFGVLGMVSSVLLPLVGLVQKDRVLVILMLLAWSILAHFAPSAWYAGQRYLDQCRALGFAPAPAARTGKFLGRLASFLLVLEFSALSVFVAIQALSGKIVCPLWK